MNQIELDLSKLLGFKIIATEESHAALRSAEIGGKGCTAIGTAAVLDSAVLRAKIGNKPG